MKYYHATSVDAFNNILTDGVLKTGFDGIVYLAESREDALKFIALRLINQPIIMLEIKVPDQELIIETFDHSYKFFKCRSFGYPKNISTDYITNVWRYN